MTGRADPLATIDAVLDRLSDQGVIALHIRLQGVRADVSALVEADREYDAALAAFNNTAATLPHWPQMHARFEAARDKRAAALSAFGESP